MSACLFAWMYSGYLQNLRGHMSQDKTTTFYVVRTVNRATYESVIDGLYATRQHAEWRAFKLAAAHGDIEPYYGTPTGEDLTNRRPGPPEGAEPVGWQVGDIVVIVGAVEIT